jgi:hypothetical protein
MTTGAISIRWILISLLHALLLSVLTLIWMNLSWEFSDEVIVARINQIVRYEILNSEEPEVEFFKKELLCVNGSYDKTLVPYSDDSGEGWLPITDRRKMAAFLQIVAQAPIPPKLILVDYFFDYPTQEDSLLRHALALFPNVIISAQQDESGAMIRTWPELKFALAQYATTTGTFLKYNIVKDSALFVPAAMYQLTHQVNFSEFAGLARSSNGWWLNSFMVDLPIRQSHLDHGDVLIWNLGDALTSYDARDVQEIVAGKIILLGDFRKYDEHETLLGKQPGPLIVANAYLSLLKGVPRLYFIDFLFVFLLYFIASMYVFIWRSQREQIVTSSLYRWRVGKVMLKYLTYVVLFSLYSIFLYLLTSRHFQLLLFAIYFNILEFGMDRHRQNIELKKITQEMESQHTHSID